MSKDFVEALGKLGIGIDRLIRYSYGGVLLLVFAVLFHHDEMKKFIDAMTPLLTALATVVIGAAIYVLHRSTVTEGLAYVLIGIFRFRFRKEPQKSPDPTTYLGNFVDGNVFTRRRAYRILRRSDFFLNKEELNVTHAETGMLMMTSTGLFLAWAYGWWFAKLDTSYLFLMPVVAVVCLIASLFKDYEDHTLECMMMKAGKKDRKLAPILKDAGFDLTPDGLNLLATEETQATPPSANNTPPPVQPPGT